MWGLIPAPVSCFISEGLAEESRLLARRLGEAAAVRAAASPSFRGFFLFF